MEALSLTLAEVPVGSVARSVIATAVVIDGRNAMRVTLSPDAAAGQADVDYIDQPTFLRLPMTLRDGRIEVDIRSGLTTSAPEYARGFAGIAYRIAGDAHRFESIYVRPLNGLSLFPPPPREARAVQYFAYPDWPYHRLRDEFPSLGFEAGADIRPGTWHRLTIELDERAVRVTIDGTDVLMIDGTLDEPRAGGIGLWVDIGTEAFFANLRVTAR
jgi:hypothetical protein